MIHLNQIFKIGLQKNWVGGTEDSGLARSGSGAEVTDPRAELT